MNDEAEKSPIIRVGPDDQNRPLPPSLKDHGPADRLSIFPNKQKQQVFLEVYLCYHKNEKHLFEMDLDVVLNFAQDILRYFQPTHQDRILEVLENIEKKLS